MKEISFEVLLKLVKTRNSKSLLRSLVNNGADINKCDGRSSNWASIHYAGRHSHFLANQTVKFGRTEIVKELLASGCSIPLFMYADLMVVCVQPFSNTNSRDG